MWLWTIPFRSFGFLVINVCNHGQHYETPCIFLMFWMNTPPSSSKDERSKKNTTHNVQLTPWHTYGGKQVKHRYGSNPFATLVGEQQHAPASLPLGGDPVLLPNIQDRCKYIGSDYSVGEGTWRLANQLRERWGQCLQKLFGPLEEYN
jgi:hypothetical protein